MFIEFLFSNIIIYFILNVFFSLISSGLPSGITFLMPEVNCLECPLMGFSCGCSLHFGMFMFVHIFILHPSWIYTLIEYGILGWQLVSFSPLLPFTCVYISDVAFSDWLLSLNNMHRRSLCVFSWLEVSFLFSAE